MTAHGASAAMGTSPTMVKVDGASRTVRGVTRARFGSDGSSRPSGLARLPSVRSDSRSRVLTTPVEPHMVQIARRWVRETLGRWGLGELADRAVQIASELVANTVRHADRDSSVVLLLMFAAGTLRLEVRDRDRRNLPVVKDPSPFDVDGRGLVIVVALSDRWGVRVTDVGKSVWGELDIARVHAAGSTGGREEIGT